jgi:hypothetical protein
MTLLNTTEKYKVVHHFNFKPCLHYSSVSGKNWLSCDENWVEVPNWITELSEIEIVEPTHLKGLTKMEWDILRQWSE